MACPKMNCARQPQRPLSDLGITRDISENRGRYEYAHGGHLAELTYSITSPTLIIADHTAVPDAFRGQGIGAKLVERLVADAGAEGVKIMPLCPFVNAQRRRHPEWADVFAV